MAILPILTAPHPVLAKKAREVRKDELGPAMDQLLTDMAETMYAAPGVGLAAPQIGDGRRIVTIDSSMPDGQGSGLLKMINPTITYYSEDTLPWTETCLSVPDFEVTVQRSKHVTVTWWAADGTVMEQDFHEFEAVIVQHELDHLLGTILLDKVSAFRRGRYLKKVRRARAGASRARA